MRWHPDKHSSKSEAEKKKAEEQFKLISEAYSVLSDKDKRRTYDQFGKEGLQPGGAPPPIGTSLELLKALGRLELHTISVPPMLMKYSPNSLEGEWEVLVGEWEEVLVGEWEEVLVG